MLYRDKFRIRMEDIGTDGAATNKALMGILEEISIMHSASVGFGVEECMELKKGWILLDWNVEVIHRPLYGEVVEAYTWARKNDKIAAYRDYEMKDKKGNVIVRGTSRWLLMDMGRKRPCRLDESIGERYDAEPEKIAICEDLVKIDYPAEVTGDELSNEIRAKYHVVTKPYALQRRDIDFNQHMHNLSYLDVAMEALPEEVYTAELSQIRIEYKKEIKPGDTVLCTYCRCRDGRDLVLIHSKEKINSIIEFRRS